MTEELLYGLGIDELGLSNLVIRVSENSHFSGF